MWHIKRHNPKDPAVYILSNQRRNVLYIGVTSDLITRLQSHRKGKGSTFCQRYNLRILLYFERYNRIVDAIAREKQLKRWKRKWKFDLIKELNPELNDLFFQII